MGSGTALADSPRLNVRLEPECPVQPLRVLLDGRGQVTESPLLDTAIGSTLVFTTCAPASAMELWEKAGVEVKVVPAVDGSSSMPLSNVHCCRILPGPMCCWRSRFFNLGGGASQNLGAQLTGPESVTMNFGAEGAENLFGLRKIPFSFFCRIGPRSLLGPGVQSW